MGKTKNRVWEEGEEQKSYTELKKKWPEVFLIERDGENYKFRKEEAENFISLFGTPELDKYGLIPRIREMLINAVGEIKISKEKLQDYLNFIVFHKGRRVAIIEPLEAGTSGRG